MSGTAQTYRVLIVDDEVPILQFVDRVLRRAGYETTIALGATVSLERWPAEASVDLLVTDLAMPEMSGDELARQLCQRQPELKVLYVTGFSDRLFAERPTLRSNEAFVEKPVTITGLLEAVSLLLFGHTRGLPPAPRG